MTVLLLAVIFAGALALLTDLVLHVSPWGRIPADKDARATFVDLIKVSLAVAGGVGAAVALVVAYRRQRHLEVDDAGKRSRYAAAAQELGDPEAAVRMAGAYAMAHLADEWPEQRQQCVDVLCAYLRLPWVVDDPSSVESTSFTIQRVYSIGEGGQHIETRVYTGRSGEREVRRTLTRIITDHLRATSAVSWAELRLDLTGATLVDATFTAAHTGQGFTMNRAHFVGATSFRGAAFSGDVDFGRAVFSGRASFDKSTFSGDADFGVATFSGDAGFDTVAFSGDADFSGAVFSGRASFDKSTFSGDADFGMATFSGYAGFDTVAFSGDASFDTVAFSEYVDFHGAAFPRGASFRAAAFSWDVAFLSAEFSGDADFGMATFSENAGFGGAVFSGRASFDSVVFSGYVDFDKARFPTSPSFHKAKFPGGSTWMGARLPSRKVFEKCEQRPAPEELDNAIYGDEPDPSG